MTDSPADRPFTQLAAAIAFGSEGTDRLNRGACPSCGCAEPATTIRDPLSRREYHISGLCQQCQDTTFGREEE